MERSNDQYNDLQLSKLDFYLIPLIAESMNDSVL